MEQISGISNWKLIIRREETGITLLRAATCDIRASLPDSLFGLPVTALGDHALCPASAPVEGEEVQITCGLPDGDFDNCRLQELVLPAGLSRVGDYAFLNCRKLTTLHLHDRIAVWGGGVLMNCQSLSTFHITWDDGEQGDSLAYLADALSRELHVTIDDGRSSEFRLVFPEYVELYEENCPARIFDYNIQGAGYPYHHCFRGKKLNLLEYDELWKGLLTMDYEKTTALCLAWYRLRYPVQLGEKAKTAYRLYLQDNIRQTMTWLLEEGTASDFSELLRWAEPDREELSHICALARERGAAEIMAVLLENQNRRFSRKKTFDL